MDWPALAGGLLSIIGIANILVSLKSRADIAELSLKVTERMVQTDKDTRVWAETEFARKETVAAQLETIRAAKAR